MILLIQVILGEGIALFPNRPKESTLKLKESIDYPKGIVRLVYEK